MKTFIITDPCYIINRAQYDAIGNAGGWGNFENMQTPCELLKQSGRAHKEDNGVKIVIHEISGTPNGDGSYEYHGQWIGVDAGLLCIAECAEGWEDERYGAKFDTLRKAKSAFPVILKHF